MSDVDKDTVQRIQKLLMGDGGGASLPLARAAAFGGDVEMLKILHEAYGAKAFIGKNGAGRRIDAMERAAAGNQVDAMRWMVDAGIFQTVHHSVSSPFGTLRIECAAAKDAADAGSFEALEFLAEKVPALKSVEMYDSAGVVSFTREHAIGATKFSEVNFLGLLALAITVAETKGRDTAPMLHRFAEHIAGGLKPAPRDMKMAMDLGSVEVFRIMLEAGGMITQGDFTRGLLASERAISMLRMLNEHLARSEKKFQNVFCAEGKVQESYQYDAFITTNGSFPPIARFMNDVAKLIATTVSESNSSIKQEFESDQDALAEQLMMLFTAIVPDGISPAMLARTTGADCLPLARRLLENGVNPNAIPQWWEGHSVSGHAPIHRCTSARMVRLLHQYGADVNRPLSHKMTENGAEIDGNLFTLMCSQKELDKPDMVLAFAECGGDLNRKYSGRTVTQLSAHRSEEFRQAIFSIKSGHVIAATLDAVTNQSQQNVAPDPRVRSIASL